MLKIPRGRLRALLAPLALAAAAASLTAPSAGAIDLKLPHLGGPAPAAADTKPAPRLKVGEWPQSRSDLKADPSIRFGALPNGMRYAIMKNATPPGVTSFRLRFDAGSLMESDEQQGLAHFLEHLAFQGSTSVPRGEMVKILERHGLAFGADTNAQTEFGQTDYKLDLPKTDTDTIDTSLMLLREVAGNLLLTQEAIDHERGVILSEERTRDTPSYRIYKNRLQFLMPGQLPPKRLPIGLVPVVQNAQRAQIADFYGKYYRPERAVLIVVGDFDPDEMEAKIKARFSDWKASAPAGAEPDLGRVASRGVETRLAVEPGAQMSLQLAWVTPPDLSADNVAKRQRDWIERLGFAVLNRRLSTLARGDSPPFIAAGAFRGNQVKAERITTMVVNVDPDHWREGLAAAVAEQRRAAQFGVRPEELAREISEIEAELKQSVAQAATRNTPAMANDIESTLEEDDVETSPADDLALFDTVTKGLSAQTVSDALKASFEGSGPLVFVASPSEIDGGEGAIKTAYQTDHAAPVTPPAALTQATWPYTDFGTPSPVAEQKDIADLDTVFVRFGNGVRLTVKQTKFKDDQILVRVRVGDGLEGFAADHQSMGWAGSALIEGGLKQISADDGERVLAPFVYGASFGAEDDALAFSGATRPDDLPVQLQVLAAYVSDPGWRPEAFQRVKTYGLTLEDQYDATDSGVLSRDLGGLLHSGDRRWTFPSRPELASESLDDLKSQIARQLAAGSVEVTVVGDITVEKAIDAVAQTFGALPTRPDPAGAAPPAVDPAFPKATAQPVVLTHKGRSDQAIGVIAWPTDDFFANPQAARVDSILGAVMQLRMLDVLRQKEGVTYSPSAGSSASTIWPHYGYLRALVEVPPAKLDGFFADVADIVADLKAKPVSADELDRAKKPAIEGLDKARNTNEYWLSALAGAQADPRRLDSIRAAQSGLERITAEDVQKAAQTRLRDDTAWKLEVRPAGS